MAEDISRHARVFLTPAVAYAGECLREYKKIEMKHSLTDEIKELFSQGHNWLKLEIEYAKLTVAEKVTILMSVLIIGAICLLMGMVVLILLAFSLVELFKMMMVPALAYLSVGGIICLLIVLLYVFRKPILLNPIARFVTRLFIDK